MGFNSEGGMPVVFDLETAAIPDADKYMEAPSAPSNYKSPEAIEKYIAEATAKQLDKAALDIDLNRIVAIGYDPYVDALGVRVECCPDEQAERIALKKFWADLGDRPLLGFKCLTFDVPTLLRRSLYLGVDPRPVVMGKYRHPGIIDLMEVLGFDGLVNYRGLTFYCKRFGLDVPDDATSGADIARLVAASDWDGVASHCRSDVIKTSALARRIGLLPSLDTI